MIEKKLDKKSYDFDYAYLFIQYKSSFDYVVSGFFSEKLRILFTLFGLILTSIYLVLTNINMLFFSLFFIFIIFYSSISIDLKNNFNDKIKYSFSKNRINILCFLQPKHKYIILDYDNLIAYVVKKNSIILISKNKIFNYELFNLSLEEIDKIKEILNSKSILEKQNNYK